MTDEIIPGSFRLKRIYRKCAYDPSKDCPEDKHNCFQDGCHITGGWIDSKRNKPYPPIEFPIMSGPPPVEGGCIVMPWQKCEHTDRCREDFCHAFMG